MEQPPSIETRSSVLGRIKNPDDSDTWQTFFDIYGALICGQALSAGLTEDEAKEVTQEMLIEISQRIQSFEYDRQKGSFKGWLYNLTRWRIANQFRKRRRGLISTEIFFSEDDTVGTLEASLFTDTADERWERQWRQALFDAALRNLRRELSPKHFQVLDFLIVKEWSVQQVAETLRTKRAHIYVLKLRVVAALKNEVKRLENQRI